MIPSFVGDRSTTKNIFSLIAEGVSFVRKNKLMRSIYIGILGAFGAGGLVAGVAQAYVATLGAGNAGYSILFGAVFTGLALGMLIGPKVLPTVPRRMIFTPSIGAAGISLIVMSVLQDFLGAVLAASVMGVFAGIAWINGFTMIGHEVSDQLRGRVFAFVMSSVRIVLLGTIAAGPVLAGAIGSYQVRAGDFRLNVSGPAIVLAVGGLIAFLVSLFIGRQIGGLTSGLTRRIFGRRGVSIWDEQDNHTGVLIAVESADPLARAEYAVRIEQHLDTEGWRVIRVRTSQTEVQPSASGVDSPAQALRASADLADLTTERVRPALQAGAVVVCEGFVDATIVAHRAAGVEEQRFARVAQWAVNGLKADLTVVVDGESGVLDQGVTEDEAPPASPELLPIAEGQPVADARSNAEDAPAERVGQVTAGLPDRAPMPDADKIVDAVDDADTGDDEEPVQPVQAYRDRASYTPERYLLVRPLSEENGVLNPEVVERVTSVLRQRSPSLAEPQPAS
jgi:dTMP kinase